MKNLGLSDPAVAAAWPRWWSDEADFSASARAELRFGIARRLGLDPVSLLEDQPRFLWREEARFKNLRSEDDQEKAGIASFGRAVAGAALAGTPGDSLTAAGLDALELRSVILAAGAPYVSLVDLLAYSWGAGIPVLHLRVFPWVQKRMAAMTVRVGERNCVLLARDDRYPPWTAFHLAHELGHLALGHISADEALVDLDESAGSADADEEEQEADRWALTLLAGRPDVQVVSAHGHASIAELARIATESAGDLGIEPGTLALLFGYSTGEWAIANGSLSGIYPSPYPVWRVVNQVARQQLALDALTSDSADFLSTVLELDDV